MRARTLVYGCDADTGSFANEQYNGSSFDYTINKFNNMAKELNRYTGKVPAIIKEREEERERGTTQYEEAISNAAIDLEYSHTTILNTRAAG